MVRVDIFGPSNVSEPFDGVHGLGPCVAPPREKPGSGLGFVAIGGFGLGTLVDALLELLLSLAERPGKFGELAATEEQDDHDEYHNPFRTHAPRLPDQTGADTLRLGRPFRGPGDLAGLGGCGHARVRGQHQRRRR